MTWAAAPWADRPWAAQDAPAGGAYTLTADRGAFTLSGQAALLAYGRWLTAARGQFVLTGNDATLTYTAGYTYTLTAARGAFTFTGQAAALSQPARVMSAAAGAFTLDGKDAALQLGSGMVGRRGRRTKTRFLPPAEPEVQETPQEATGLVSEEAMTLLIQDQAGKAIRKARVSATKRRLEIQSHNVKALESTLMEWF